MSWALLWREVVSFFFFWAFTFTFNCESWGWFWAVANYIHAYKADSGDLLYPKSWKEMICSRTGIIEGRKVAKPI